ncbi:MAG: LCP family protein [Clostridia bacterium]
MKKNTKADNKKKENKKRKKNRGVMKTVVTLLCLLIIAGFSFLGYKIYKNGGGLTGTLATLLGESTEELENLEPIQVLIMGESGVDDYKLADSIMVASYNPKTQEASIMSIPRDTYVGKKDRTTASQNYLASYKINTVFRNGTNIPEAIERINELTGLELENYVIIDTKALIKLVDAIGGVTFDVPIDMNYEDESQDLYIHLKAGEQLIDGAKAEQLLRFRHNDNGSTYPADYGMEDYGRMRTQREFIMATLKQTLKPQNIFKLKQIIDIMQENVTTNMEISELKSYIPYAVNFNAENIKTGMVPGESEMCNGVSLYIANKKKTAELVEELFPEPAEDDANTEIDGNTVSSQTSSNSNIKIEVLNGSGDSDNLSEVVKKLTNAGYNVTKQGTTNITQKTTITNKTNKESSIVADIKEIIGVGVTNKSTSTSTVDFTIIIGQDY